MPSQYRLVLQNSSGRDSNFIVFTNSPALTPSSEVYTVAWFVKRVPDNGTAEVTISNDFHAFAAQSRDRPGPGVTIDASVSRRVNLGNRDDSGSLLTMMYDYGSPNFTGQRTDNSCKDADFAISCEGQFRREDNILIGTALSNPDSGRMVPISAIVAQPYTVQKIKPSTTWYVYRDEAQAGQIIDFRSIKDQAGELNFSENQKTLKAEFTSGRGWNIRPQN